MDMDRTILPSSLALSPATLKAVAAVKRAGIEPIIATGRMFASARPYALELGITAPVICYQGALVADPQTRGVAAARADRRPARARGDRGRAGRGLPHERVRQRPAVRRAAHARGAHVRRARPPRDGRGRRLRQVAAPADDQDRDRRRAARAGRPRGAPAGGVRRPPVHRQVAARLPGGRAARGYRRARRSVRVRPARASTRPTRSRSATAPTTSSCCEAAGLGVAVADADPALLRIADWTVPSVSEDGVAGFLSLLVDSRA